MKYFIRSVKSFISFSTIFFLVLLVLVYTNNDVTLATAFDPEFGLFKANSEYKILAFFLAIAAIYPALTYVKKEIFINGTFEDHKDTIIRIFTAAGYIFVSADEEAVTFRKKSQISRFMRLYEDKITITKEESPLILNGIRKDIIRIAGSIQYNIKRDEEERIES